ncbi:MAG: preprotein translocase subunit SecG [Ignavibacteriaceae bacterium]|nr:preprotein translocase subunit SecG [Ignavibacteriaceae bacterium]
MYLLIVSIITIIAILLVVIVLLQSSKGGGLAGTFGGASQMGSMFGSRRTADFLSRATWWLAGILTALTLMANIFFLPGQTTDEQRQSIIQQAGRRGVPQQQQLPPQQTAPQQTQPSPTE